MINLWIFQSWRTWISRGQFDYDLKFKGYFCILPIFALTITFEIVDYQISIDKLKIKHLSNFHVKFWNFSKINTLNNLQTWESACITQQCYSLVDLLISYKQDNCCFFCFAFCFYILYFFPPWECYFFKGFSY